MSRTTTKPRSADSANGELAREQAARDKAANAAKVAAAEKAAQVKEAFSVLEPITLEVHAAAAETRSAGSTYDSARMRFGMALLATEGVLAAFPALSLSIRQYAEIEEPDESGPVWGSCRAYRSLKAARVAQGIRGGTGDTSVDALESAHRIASVPGAAAKVFSAAKKAAGRNRTVRRHHIEAALEDLFPKSEENTPGPAKGSQTAKAGGKAKAARNTPAAKGPVDVPDHAITATTLKAAASRIAGILESPGTPIILAAQVCKCCEDYGIGATKAALQGVAATTLKAAKPRTTKRTTTK